MAVLWNVSENRLRAETICTLSFTLQWFTCWQQVSLLLRSNGGTSHVKVSQLFSKLCALLQPWNSWVISEKADLFLKLALSQVTMALHSVLAAVMSEGFRLHCWPVSESSSSCEKWVARPLRKQDTRSAAWPLKNQFSGWKHGGQNNRIRSSSALCCVPLLASLFNDGHKRQRTAAPVRGQRKSHRSDCCGLRNSARLVHKVQYISCHSRNVFLEIQTDLISMGYLVRPYN